jgi:hypothetical protein
MRRPTLPAHIEWGLCDFYGIVDLNPPTRYLLSPSIQRKSRDPLGMAVARDFTPRLLSVILKCQTAADPCQCTVGSVTWRFCAAVTAGAYKKGEINDGPEASRRRSGGIDK